MTTQRRWMFAGGVLATLCAGVAFAADDSTVPNFGMDAKVGWITGVQESNEPIGDDFLPPESGPGPVMSDPAHPYIDNAYANRIGGQPTFHVADLTNPTLRPWVREHLRQINRRVLAGEPVYTPKERCWPIGVPGWMLYPVTPVYFLQTPKVVTLIWQEDHMVRHIYMNEQHPDKVKPSWFGHSIGHYENGDTLVIDTVGINTRTYVDQFRTPHSEQLHVVERYRITDDGKSLEASATVEDPGAFTTVWSGRQHYRRDERGPMQENVCSENNEGFFERAVEPIPTADRPDF